MLSQGQRFQLLEVSHALKRSLVVGAESRRFVQMVQEADCNFRNKRHSVRIKQKEGERERDGLC